ncbi:MAG: hypothetical protein ACYTEQ_20850 [Planctomycetota bacterium]|jgi:hypothetical protein
MTDNQVRYQELTKRLHELLVLELNTSNLEPFECPECKKDASLYSLFLPQYSGGPPNKTPQVVKYSAFLLCKNPDCGLELKFDEDFEKYGIVRKIRAEPSPELRKALEEFFSLCFP